MSDTLAILDAAVARVSALLVPDSLSALAAFLRGDPYDSCDAGPSQSPPNLLVSLYEFLPLAIAPHDSLVTVSAVGERSALAQHFERCGFRVFSLNLSHTAREDCVDALRLWCATDTHETTANRKRSRSGAHNAEALRCALCIVHCCAGSSTGVGGPRPGAAAPRSRSRSALLHSFLHDVAALSALCRARRALHRSWAVRLSVLLVPSDHAHGASLLEEELRDAFGSLFCVRLFNPHRATASDECGDAFRREVAAWLAAPADDSAWLRDSSLFFVRRDNLPLCCFLREAMRRFPIVLAPAALRQLQALWAARRQLSDCAAGLHAILSPYTCSSPSSSSSSSFSFSFSSCARGASGAEGEGPAPDPMAQLRDGAHVINALLDAAERWAGGHAANAAVAFAALYEDAVWRRPARLGRVPGVVEALRRIWCRNRRHSEGEQSSSGSSGSRRRRGTTTTTTHTEEGKEEKEKEKEKEEVWSVRAALATCVPVHQSRFPLSLGHDLRASQEFVDSSRDVVAIPQILAVPSARVSVSGELLSAALLAVVPPQESLDALKGRAAITTSNSNNCAHTMDNVNDNHHDHHEGEDNDDDDGGGGGYMALNNFFSPWVPDSVRLLHVLATHAVGQTSAREKFLSLAILQRVCQMSDEALLRALKELQLAGMITVNGREMKARTLLEV